MFQTLFFHLENTISFSSFKWGEGGGGDAVKSIKLQVLKVANEIPPFLYTLLQL